MTSKRLLNWLIPSAAVLLVVIPTIIDLRWRKAGAHYAKKGNHSCALARGYAREFEAKHGRKPNITELSRYASERFAAQLENSKMDWDYIANWNDRAPD
jgi:hypothetical protein